MPSRLPPLLEPYLARPPESSLVLLTGIVGASTNWLVLRYLYALLHASATGDEGQAPTRVVLVSFLRDLSFWEDGAGRIGIDLQAQGRKGHLTFVDGLSGLFTGAGARARPAWERTPACAADVGRSMHEAVDEMTTRGKGKVVLVVDGLDLFLAAAGEDVSAHGLRDLVLDLREKVHAAIVAVAADEPLVMARTTALEMKHASLVLSLAHEAEVVLGLGLLDTGVAKDVSGVMRITRGGQSCGRLVEEKEYLYHVGGDGSARVFERGQ